MKKLIIFIFLLAFLSKVNSLKAQIKKVIAKPKPVAVAVALVPKEEIKKIDFFDKTPEDLIQVLNDEFKKAGLTIKDINDFITYKYDAKGKSTKQPISTLKTISFNKDATVIYVNTDSAEKVSDISFTTKNYKYFKQIKKLVGCQSWSLVASNETDTTLKSGNLYANISKDTANIQYNLSLKKSIGNNFTSNQTVPFNAANLSLENNANDLGNGIIAVMKLIGLDFLYKSNNVPIVSEKQFMFYSTRFNFTNFASVDINTSATNKNQSIVFSVTDAVIFYKLKKALNVTQWQSKPNGTNDGTETYSLNNIDCSVNSKDKIIIYTVNPLVTDIKTRYENTIPIDAENLVNLYLKNDSATVKKIIQSTYVNLVDVDWQSRKIKYNPIADPFDFYFKSPADSLCYVSYEYKLSNTHSRIIYFATKDFAYFDKIKTALNEMAQPADAPIIIAVSTTPNTTTGMQNINIYSKAQGAVIAEYNRQQEEQKERDRQAAIARQQREREEKAERDRLKAEKDAKTAKDIENVTNSILEGLKKLKKN